MKKFLVVALVMMVSSAFLKAQPSFVFDSTEFCGLAYWLGGDWSDYDNDGDLDLFVIGQTKAAENVKRLYKNDGSGSFTRVDIASLPTVISGAVAWGDYDKDGDQDLLYVGYYFGTYYCRVYRNDGGDNFNLAVTGLKGLNYPSCAWGDYDNDGDLDMIISGKDDTKCTSIIYRNDNGSFTNIGANLFGTQSGRVEWGDFDSDGDLDLIISGYDYYYAFNSKVYKNKGNDIFADMDASLEAANPHFFDYNSDGKLDIISGTKVYKNTGDSSFVSIGATIPYNLSPQSSTTDYDNDGDLDVLHFCSGHFQFYRYDGGTTYSSTPDYTTNIRSGSALWFDYNNDNKRDFFAFYQDGSYNGHFRLYKNTYATANTAPTVPAGISAVTRGSSVRIKWTKSTDTKTAQNGIHYNVRIGTTKTSIDILNPDANLSTGYRKLPGYGNCATRDSFVFGGLKPGKYYYNVQAIDNNFAPSAFSPVDSFVIPPFDNARSFGFKKLHSGSISWGDYDNDGDMDALVNGALSNVAYTYIYRNDGNYTFTEINPGLKGVYSGSTEWGDYDNDGDLDIALSGNTKFTYPNFQPISAVYRNDGNDKFTDLNLPLTGVYEEGKLKWGDYDNDGRLDLMLGGYYRLLVYHNDGNDKFTQKQIGSSDSYFNVSWVDYDNDNDLDISADSSFDWWHTYHILIRNNGDGTFSKTGSKIAIGLFLRTSKDWADYDNDGDMDLCLSDSTTSVYRNDGGALTKVFAATDPKDSTEGQISWGDFDNDGDPDIILSNGYVRLYRNDGGVFNIYNTAIDDQNGVIRFADIDNDNDLDVTMTYGSSDFTNGITFFLNNSSPDHAPEMPTGLSHSFTLGTDQVNFSWTKATDIEQSGSKADGLSYNLWVKSIDDNKVILDPMSDVSTGFRKINCAGTTGTDASYTLRNLAQGTYIWKVQAVDHTFKGSLFSDVDTFKVGLFADTPSDITLCAGDTITVPMHLDGLAVQYDNTFIAQLSDPYGYFDVPTQIAAVAGTQSATIQVVIPPTAIAGIKYKIRFLTTNPRYVGVPNMPYITINPRPQPMINGKPIVCQKDIGIDYKTYNAQGNTYVWTVTNGTITSGQNSAQVLVKWGTSATGKVTVTESNSLGCKAVSVTDIVINPLPSVSLGSDVSFCLGQSITKDPGAFYAYNWNTGAQTRTLKITESGDYFVSITDDNACKGSSDTLHVNVLKPYDEQICMVTTDSATGKNKIIWERTKNMRSKSYNIYKISGTSYKLLGNIPGGDLSVYNDLTSNPQKVVDRYAITTIDSCNNESAKSYYHQTMLLQAAKGTSTNEAVLSWSKYIDESGSWIPEYYYIYKGKTKANIALLDSVSGLLEPRFNDQSFDGVSAFYMIAVKRNQLCSPAVLKAESGPYAQSLSNLAEFKAASASSVEELPVSIYPNPFSEYITIDFTLFKNSNVLIEIVNSTGQKTACFSYNNLTAGNQQIVLNASAMNVPEGMSYIRIIADDKASIIKIHYIK